MTEFSYDPKRTGLVVVDALNDFISENGKLWDYTKEVVLGLRVLENLRRLTAAARKHGVRIFHAPMATQEWDYKHWHFKCLTHNLLFDHQIFKAGSWGAEFHPDFKPHPGEVVVAPHKGLDAFSGTDLDVQLRQNGIDNVVLCGLLTNTCIESTGRQAFEKGYHLTFIKDAVGALSWEAHNAAVEINWPRFAHGIRSTDEFISQIGSGVRFEKAL